MFSLYSMNSFNSHVDEKNTILIFCDSWLCLAFKIGADLSKSLSDLGLLNRQALMVVPHQRAVAHRRGVSSSRDLTNSTNDSGSANDSNGGYFALLRSFLSYLNPLSYLGSTANSSNSEQESQNSMWEYREFQYPIIPLVNLCWI